jgi:hypothetical protein
MRRGEKFYEKWFIEHYAGKNEKGKTRVKWCYVPKRMVIA